MTDEIVILKDNKIYDIPNMYQSPYSVIPYTVNSKDFFFEFDWNIREAKAYLSIYYVEDNQVIYILRPTSLTYGYNLAKNIRDKNWIGELFLYPYNEDVIEYNIKNISTDFALMYRDWNL